MPPDASPDPIHVVGAAILRDGTCLAAQRSATMSNPLMWEFPGGKIEPGESPREALKREIHEELGIAIDVHDPLPRGTELTATGRRVLLDVYTATWRGGGEVRLAEHARWGWFGPAELRDLTFAQADQPALRALLKRLDAARPDGAGGV